jgi:hypothetical protein
MSGTGILSGKANGHDKELTIALKLDILIIVIIIVETLVRTIAPSSAS